MAKYAAGTRVTYKNGAVAVAQANGMLKIVSGPTKGSKRRNISKRSAKRAFNKYWNKRSSAVKDNKKRSRGVASARGRDILYGSPNNLRKHSGYKQNPGRLDYTGVDYGSRRYKVSPNSLANLRRRQGGGAVWADEEELDARHAESVEHRTKLKKKQLRQKFKDAGEYVISENKRTKAAAARRARLGDGSAQWAGAEVTVFKNGARAVMQPNGRYKIISGPTKGSKRRNISKRSAKRAFNKYWNKRSAAVKGNKMRSRGVASARGRDILYGSPKNLRKHSGYKQNPGRLDYAGVDYGSRRYKVSPKSLANLRKN